MSKNVSLWALLKRNRVAIPIIQRDYAQGRAGKEYIRDAFLAEIKENLDKGKKLILDFVYGNIDGDCFYPLDGQQRLTTLWLLHWYFSFKSGKLSEDASTLKRFTYETRVSSRDFCIALCDEMKAVKSSDVDKSTSIASFIKSQTWFYSEWLLDSTISSMLRALSGDSEEKKDCIEDFFSGTDYNRNRDLLIADDGIISFVLMEIGHDELPISDDLYIKMNARGKGLTDFENFKADLVSWIQNNLSTDYSENPVYYPKEIDNCWTDVFWTIGRKDPEFKGKIDGLFFAFINRFFTNIICLDATADIRSDGSDAKKDFDKLFGTGLAGNSNADDGMVRYEGFDVYNHYLTTDVIKTLHNIFISLCNNEILEDVYSFSRAGVNETSLQDESFDDNLYYFFPRMKYDEEKPKINRVTFKNRVYFLAISMFLNRENIIYDDTEKKNFKDWIRVVCNITENSAMDGIPAFVSCLRKINDIGSGASAKGWNVYEYLNTIHVSIDDCKSPLDRQFAEEVAKAKRIIENPSSEERIIEAENYAFFNGTIRFLFYDESGNANWNEFDDRFLHAKELFNQSGNEDVPFDTVRSLLNTFDDFTSIQGKYLFTKKGYHNRMNCWKKDILCSSDSVIIHNVYTLLKVGSSQSASKHRADHYDAFINHNGYLKSIYDNPRNDSFRVHGYRQLAVHKDYSQRNEEYWYISDPCIKKNMILHQLCIEQKIEMELDNSSFEGFYPGYQINFTANGICYGYECDSGSTFKLIGEERVRDQDSAFIWENRNQLLQNLGIIDG